MGAGCPVVTTNTSSIPVVAGSIENIVDKIEKRKFINKMELVLDPQIIHDWIQFGYNNSSKFSWAKCFKELYGFYK